MPLDFLFNDSAQQINRLATRKAVRIFFKEKYPHIKALASYGVIQSVKYDSPKVQTSRNNSIEERTIRIAQAKQYLDIIDQVINSLDDTKKKIFISKAIKNLTGFQVEQLTGYSQTRVMDLYGEACEQIAENLALISDIDLRRYERN